LVNFKGSGKIKKIQDGGSKMATILEPDVVDLKGNTFGCIIRPPSFIVIALIFSELRGGGQISTPHPSPPHPLVPEDQKNPV